MWLTNTRLPSISCGFQGRQLRCNGTDQKPCKPVRRVKSIKRFVPLIPVRRHYIVLQPEQTQGLLGVYRALRDGIDDATIKLLFHHEAKLISIAFLCQTACLIESSSAGNDRVAATGIVPGRQGFCAVPPTRWPTEQYSRRFFYRCHGANAVVSGQPVLPRNTRRYAAYFHGLALIAPGVFTGTN